MIQQSETFERLKQVLSSIKLYTMPVIGYIDPKSVIDRWNEVDDMLAELSNPSSPVQTPPEAVEEAAKECANNPHKVIVGDLRIWYFKQGAEWASRHGQGLAKFIKDIEKCGEIGTDDKAYTDAYEDGWSDCIITFKNRFLAPKATNNEPPKADKI
jgi:hypothetical protein